MPAVRWSFSWRSSSANAVHIAGFGLVSASCFSVRHSCACCTVASFGKRRQYFWRLTVTLASSRPICRRIPFSILGMVGSHFSFMSSSVLCHRSGPSGHDRMTALLEMTRFSDLSQAVHHEVLHFGHLVCTVYSELSH